MFSTVHLLEHHYFNYHKKAVAFISLPPSLQTKHIACSCRTHDFIIIIFIVVVSFVFV